MQDNLNEIDSKNSDTSYIGQRLAKVSSTNNKDYNNTNVYQSPHSPTKPRYTNNFTNQQMIDEYENHDVELYLDSNSRSSGELADTELEINQQQRYSRHFTLSPETTDYDSNCGDLDSLSNDLNGCVGINSGCLPGAVINSSNTVIPDFSRLYTSMPVLEDGLSSGHASDTENNNPISISASSATPMQPSSVMVNNTSTASSTINNIFDSKYINSNLDNMGKMLNPTPISTAAPINTTNNGIQSPIHTDLVDVLSPATAIDAAQLNKEQTDASKSIGEYLIHFLHVLGNYKISVSDGFGIGMIGLHHNQQQQQQLQKQQQPKEEKHVDSKSYLDSDITSIFSNSNSIIHFLIMKKCMNHQFFFLFTLSK